MSQPKEQTEKLIFNSEDDVSLTEEERSLILNAGLAEKKRQWREQRYFKNVYEEYAPKYPTTAGFSEYVWKRGVELCGEGFGFTEIMRPIFDTLLLYFAKDAKCTLNPNKGIILAGGIGVGKTKLMQIFDHNPLQSFDVYSAQDIANLYGDKEKGGGAMIARFGAEFHNIYNWYECWGQKKWGVCIDDMGTESSRKHFGNESNVIADIIQARYLHKVPFNQTHITTNLNGDEIEQAYGARVRSRLREMFNVIEIPASAQDLRK